MDKMNYLTIAEFAAAAKVSKQAVYKRLNKDLQPFLKIENGVKLVSTEALNLFNQSEPEVETIKPVEQPVESPSREAELERIIEEQRQEIKALTAEKTELNNRFIKMNDKLLDMISEQMRQNENYQILIGQQQKLLTPIQPVEQPNQPEVETVEQKVEPVEQPVETPKKSSFWDRFIKRQS